MTPATRQKCGRTISRLRRKEATTPRSSISMTGAIRANQATKMKPGTIRNRKPNAMTRDEGEVGEDQRRGRGACGRRRGARGGRRDAAAPRRRRRRPSRRRRRAARPSTCVRTSRRMPTERAPSHSLDRVAVEGVERGDQPDRDEDEQAGPEQQAPVVAVAGRDSGRGSAGGGVAPAASRPAPSSPRLRTAAAYAAGLAQSPSAVQDAAARSRRQRRAANRDAAEGVVDRVAEVGCELDVGGRDVLVDLLGTARADDRRGQLVAAQDPGERELHHRDARPRRRSGAAAGRPRGSRRPASA